MESSSTPLPASDVEVLPDPLHRAIAWKDPPPGAYNWPKSEAQAKSLDCDADILMMGGAAGSLKTSTMLIDAVSERYAGTMRSYFFRRTYRELEGGDGAIDQSYRLFSQTGAIYNASNHNWKWPSGAEFYFRHAQHEKDVHQYQGHAMSTLCIDESTHWPEKMVRYLITRNRSTDPCIKTRVRLGTNPGNIGHKWHQRLFMGGVCPHCETDRSKVPLQWDWNGEGLNWDSRWPSDSQPLEMDPGGNGQKIKVSTSYILSSVRDHSMYPPEYLARLKMQSAATAKALLDGCWKIFEGQYFDVWDATREGKPMVIKRRDLHEQWWWPRWVVSDYGFTISIAAAHLFIHEPQSTAYPTGRIIIADEDGCQETAATFARRLLERWVLGTDGRPVEQRWMPWFLSPDSFREIGVGFSLASQMNAVLQPYGLSFRRADNDREGGAMKMYTGMESGELVICDNCTKTIEAIESRIHDPDKENDVFKAVGDELDDYYDSARYGYKSWETARKVAKPKDVEMAEVLGELIRTDPTAAIFKYSQIQEKNKETSIVPSYGASARQRLLDSQKKR